MESGETPCPDPAAGHSAASQASDCSQVCRLSAALRRMEHTQHLHLCVQALPRPWEGEVGLPTDSTVEGRLRAGSWGPQESYRTRSSGGQA